MAYDPFFDRPALLILVHPVEIDEPLEIGLEVLRLHAGEVLDISLDPGARVGLVALVCELQVPHEGIVRLPTVVD